ncbi:MAG: hypothetical protein H0T90_03330 [Gemmatimonadales bacterium]|nr:hypothetical protein [Gemmatimonadales bacterium]
MTLPVATVVMAVEPLYHDNPGTVPLDDHAPCGSPPVGRMLVPDHYAAGHRAAPNRDVRTHALGR